MTGRKYLLGLVAAGGVAGFAAGCNEASPKLPPSRTDSGQVIAPAYGGPDSAAGPTRGRAGASVGTDTTGGAQDDSTIRSGRNTPGSITNDRETRTLDRGSGIGPSGASGMGSGTPADRRSSGGDAGTVSGSISTSGGTTGGGSGGTTGGTAAPPRSVPGETSTDTGARNDRSGNSNSRTSTGTPNGGGNSSTATEDQLRNR